MIEYKTEKIKLDFVESDDYTTWLLELGADDWNLVSVTPIISTKSYGGISYVDTEWLLYVFKRVHQLNF